MAILVEPKRRGKLKVWVKSGMETLAQFKRRKFDDKRMLWHKLEAQR